MLPLKPEKTYFDRWGRDLFEAWVMEVIERELGSEYFMPGPPQGIDAGIDAEHTNPDGISIIHQFKFHEVGAAGLPKVRTLTLTEFEDWVNAQAEDGQEKKLIFVTNVQLSGPNLERVKVTIQKYPHLRIECWEFAKLITLLRRFENLYKKYNPDYTPEEYDTMKAEQEKQKQEVERRYEQKVSDTEFQSIQYQLKSLMIDDEKRKGILLAMISLVEPYYLDNRGESTRKIIRGLLDITEKQETELLNKLDDEDKISNQDSLIYVLDTDEAQAQINRFIDGLDIPIEQVMDLIITAE